MCALLEHGADLQCVDSHGSTPFIVAVKQGHGELVTLLIDRGASKDDLSKVSIHTLHTLFLSSSLSLPPHITHANMQGMRMAASRGHKEIVKRILSVFDNDDVLAFLMQIGVGLTDTGASLEDENCAVCMENARDCVAVPCGHAACCFTCMEALPSPRLCPMCRVEIRLVQKMYLFLHLIAFFLSLFYLLFLRFL